MELHNYVRKIFPQIKNTGLKPYSLLDLKLATSGNHGKYLDIHNIQAINSVHKVPQARKADIGTSIDTVQTGLGHCSRLR